MCLGLNAQVNFNESFDAYLKKYVDQGLFKYNEARTDLASINSLISSMDQINLDSKDDKLLAQLINAYNLKVIHIILLNENVSKATDIMGIYDGIKFSLGGKKMTLDDLENKIIRKEFNEPRIHFALVCGALGCPPITNFAYRGEVLMSQLEVQTKKALNDPAFIRVDDNSKTVFLSEIFRWFKEDFTKEFDSEVAFINVYRESQIPLDYKVMYYPYDWTINAYSKFNVSTTPSPVKPSNLSNIQAYTPSKLLKMNQVEVQAFTNIYTQIAYFNENGDRTETTNRSNYYGTLFTFNYGITKSRWLNIGMDANFRSFSTDTSTSSPFDVLRFSNDGLNSRTALTSIGPKVKISPFKKLSISMQSALWIPVQDDLEGDEIDFNTGQRIRPWLAWNRYTWWNQFFYDQPIGKNNKFQIFMEADLLFRFAKDSSRYFQNQTKSSHLMTPVSFFLSYFPTKLTTIYSFVQHSPTWETTKLPYNNGEQTHIYVSTHFSQSGLGFKYQITDNLALELLYTKFFDGKHWGGAGETYNLGIRFLN
jgi:hypothetical protein